MATGDGSGQMNPSGPTIDDDRAVDETAAPLSAGPLDRFFRWMKPDAAPRQLLRYRILVLALLTWPPLLLLSIVEGRALGAAVAVPFLYDVQVHARLLLALPLLVVAELVVYQRMSVIVGQFLGRGLIPLDARVRFDAARAGAMRLRGSITAEVVMVALVYAFGVGWVWRTRGALDVASWYGAPLDGQWQPSMAGWWLMCVSLPVFQFLVLRWYFRLFVWARFLWQVSRIKLLLQPTDPDRCGGLGFLGGSSKTFAPVLLAWGTLLAGTLANRIFYEGATLLDFRIELFGMVAIMALAILGPLLPFVVQLEEAKRVGMRTYGVMAHGCVREFSDKWLSGSAPDGAALPAASDIQPLADLARAFDVVRGMNLVPFTSATVTQIAVFTLAPVLPLVLTMMPMEEVVTRLIKVIF